MRPLPLAAARQCGVFTIAQAREAGWTDSAVRHAVSGGDLIVLRRGVFAASPDPTGRPWYDRRIRATLDAAAAVLSYPGAYASHRSVALLLGLPVLDLPARPCLTAPPGHGGNAQRIHLHRATLHHADRGVFRAHRVTMPARSVVDIARELGELAGVITADAALHHGLLTSVELADAAERACGLPGAAEARAMAASVDSRAESPLESRSRLAIRDHGLPTAWPQPDISAEGRFIGRPDFYWDEFGVVGEADGWEKYEAGWQPVRDEKRRQKLLERAGLIVVRWDSDDLPGFAGAAGRLRDAFARGTRRSPEERRWTARVGLRRVS